jgi:hypothetical protein
MNVRRYWKVLREEMIEEGLFASEKRVDLAIEKIKEKL